MKIIAGIVTYNPQISRLTENVQAITDQVDEIIVFDNGSGNIDEVKALASEHPRVLLVDHQTNAGIAAAFNYIIEYCGKQGVSWVLLLDQDSVCPGNLIEQYLKYTTTPGVAIITPLVIDKRRAPRSLGRKDDAQVIKNCVSSGSFVNVEICRKLGCFEEELFIDVVDYEYCMRVRLNRYKILQINRLELDQEFGNVKVSKHAAVYQKLGMKTGINLFYHLAYSPVYSPLRVFYTVRNWVYCIRKYRRFSKTRRETMKFIKGCSIMAVRGKFNLRLLAAIWKGISSGLEMQVRPVNYDNPSGIIELM